MHAKQTKMRQHKAPSLIIAIGAFILEPNVYRILLINRQLPDPIDQSSRRWKELPVLASFSSETSSERFVEPVVSPRLPPDMKSANRLCLDKPCCCFTLSTLSLSMLTVRCRGLNRLIFASKLSLRFIFWPLDGNSKSWSKLLSIFCWICKNFWVFACWICCCCCCCCVCWFVNDTLGVSSLTDRRIEFITEQELRRISCLGMSSVVLYAGGTSCCCCWFSCCSMFCWSWYGVLYWLNWLLFPLSLSILQ